MGCDCSAPKKDEALLNEATKSGKQTVKKPSGLIDEAEMTSNGAHSNKEWYSEPEDKEDGDVLSKLSSIIGDINKDEIEKAINKAIDKSDINSVCQYMINAATNIKEERKDEPINTCMPFIRLTLVLEEYIKWMKTAKSKGNRKSLYDVIHDGNLGGNKSETFSMKQILDDYHYLMYHRNKDEDFQNIYQKLVKKGLYISLNKSNVILRNYRDRTKVINDKQRKSLYFGYTESKEITIIQLCDRIYCYYAYSFELGLRLTMKEKLSIIYAKDDEKIEDEEGSRNKLTDRKLVCLKQIIKKKQINLKNVIGKKRIESNKFISLNKSEAALFYYQENEEKSDEPIDFEGKEYQEKDWFITAKYENLKIELTQNEKSKIELSQFNDLLILANLHCESEHNIKLRQTMLDLETVESWGMNNMHVLALMAYCNFTSVQFELKQTYFRLEKESDEDLKKRHSIFGNLGKLLKEVVCDYGRMLDQTSERNAFYHSVSLKSISKTLIRFRAPISTSTSKVILYNYSSINGIIIEIGSGELDLINGIKPKYFDCSWISDFGIEEEQLFIQQNVPLELTNIINITTLEDYQLFVFALNIITIIFGDVNESWGEDKKNPFQAIPKSKSLKKLVKKVLERRASTVQPHLFGKKKKSKDNDRVILSNLLDQICINKKEMHLFWFSEKTPEHWPWIDDILNFMKESVFCKELNRNLRWVKLDLLVLFFVNLESITIVDCPLNDTILSDIDSFIKKLKIDPKEKHKKEKDENLKNLSQEPDALKKDESEIDKLMDIDIDSLVGDLKSDKSHISFKDPNFDDLCDYRQSKIKEIKILENYEPQNFNSKINTKMINRYNKKFKSSGWEMYKGEVMLGNQGFIFRKIGIAEKK